MIKNASLALVLCLVIAVNCFVQPHLPASRGLAAPRTSLTRTSCQVSRPPTTRATALSMAVANDATASKYWEGEWVCADCGYIYDADDCGGLYFEQQKKGWVCPQCRGPRRRFAKKVGDKVGITQDGGDAPILLFSFLGLGLTVAFGFWFAGQ